jgi:hypothetical protein
MKMLLSASNRASDSACRASATSTNTDPEEFALSRTRNAVPALTEADDDTDHELGCKRLCLLEQRRHKETVGVLPMLLVVDA